MVGITNLINSAKASAQQGNHRKEPGTGGAIANFIYHWTVICQTLPNKQFRVGNGGWNTRSTNKAIKAYRQTLTAKGYAEI